jgi:hypothetical protein
LNTSVHATEASAGQIIDWALAADQPQITSTRLKAKAFILVEVREIVSPPVLQSVNIVKCFIDLDLIKQFVWLVFGDSTVVNNRRISVIRRQKYIKNRQIKIFFVYQHVLLKT